MAFSLRDYEIIGHIGEGGFGSVLRARQKSLGKVVAIKSLVPQRIQDQRDILRFQREARAMAGLAHDNIVAIQDYAYQAGNYYIVMEYIDGITFEDALQKNIPLPLSVFVLERVAAALAYAHGERIVHRDVKPGNILLGKQGQVKLADFGLVAVRHEQIQITPNSAAVGTLCYMAPEAMATPDAADAQADVFSLGCILYRVLAGKLPFSGSTLGEVSYRVLNEPPPPLDTADSHAELRELALACLQKEPDARPVMDSLREQLAAASKKTGAAGAERLAAFVRGERTEAVVSGGEPMPKTPSSPAAPPPRHAVAKLVALLIAAAGIAGGAAVVRMLLNEPHALPPSPAQHSRAGASPEEKPAGDSRAASARRDGPAPVSSGAIDLEVCTVLLRGVLPSDTVVINGKRLSMQPQRGSLGIPLAPGHHSLQIRRSDGAMVTRDFEAMPYQVLEWNLKDESDAYGRKSRSLR